MNPTVVLFNRSAWAGGAPIGWGDSLGRVPNLSRAKGPGGVGTAARTWSRNISTCTGLVSPRSAKDMRHQTTSFFEQNAKKSWAPSMDAHQTVKRKGHATRLRDESPSEEL